MESRLKLHGQPVHPMLVLFPLGLFVIAVVFDFTDLVGGPSLLGVAAYWNIVAGLLGGVLVVAAGVVDLVTVRRRTRTKRFVAAHTLITIGVLAAFGASWWLRMPTAERGVNGGLFALEFLAVLACGFGAWLRTEPARPIAVPAQRTARRVDEATTILASSTSRTVRLPAALLAASRRPAAH